MTTSDRAEGRAVQQLARLHALTLALAGALGGDDVADAIVAHVLPALGAEAGIVALLDDARETLRVARVSGALARVVRPGQVLRLADRSALAEAVRQGAPLIMETRAERYARFPSMQAAEEQAGIVAGTGVALPLFASDSVVGTIGISFAADHALAEQDREFLAIVARQCGQALERARRYDTAQRELATRNAIEADLEHSRRLFERITQAAPGLIALFDPLGGANLFINNGVQMLLGYTPEQIAAHGDGLIGAIVHPDDVALVMAQNVAIRGSAEGAVLESEFRLRHADGSYRWLHSFTIAFSRDGAGAVEQALTFALDVTARRTAEETLQQHARLLDLTYDAIFVHELAGRITYWNPAAQALYGYTAAEAIGQVSHALLHTEFPPLPQPIDQIVRRQGFWEGELVHRRRDGTRVLVDSRQVLLDDARGAQALILETNRDITRRKQDEAERSTFISSITHDLRNPLATIKGQAQLLGRRAARGQSPETEALRAGLAAIDATATRMTAMLSELLDVSRMQTGQSLDLALAPVDLVMLVQDVARQVQAGTDRHTLVLESEAAELTGIWDAARLERVIGNILGNAVKYSPDGGTIAIHLDAQDLRGARPFAVLTISDDGVGIPRADLPLVFDWFFRAHNVSGRFTGNGIGLPGAKRIIDQHGGSISVASREGAGSTFTIRLPLA